MDCVLYQYLEVVDGYVYLHPPEDKKRAMTLYLHGCSLEHIKRETGVDLVFLPPKPTLFASIALDGSVIGYYVPVDNPLLYVDL